MKNRTENISVRYRPQHLTKSLKSTFMCSQFKRAMPENENHPLGGWIFIILNLYRILITKVCKLNFFVLNLV